MIVRQPEDEEETEQRQEVQQQDISKLKAKKEVTIQDTIFNLQGGKNSFLKDAKPHNLRWISFLSQYFLYW